MKVQEGEPRVNINPWFCRLLSYKENPIAEPSKFPSLLLIPVRKRVSYQKDFL